MKRIRYAAIGAALAYFFDPDNGRRRRQETIKRLAHGSGGLARGVSAQAQAVKQKAAHRREQARPEPDDVTLARQVESEIFRDAEVPKGKINVNAENGKVVLRGEADSAEMIEQLVDKARDVQGVRDVENLLHTPGQPAPMHQ